MAYFMKLIGTISQSFRLGLGGLVLKNSAGTLQVRNPADNGYASIQVWRAQFSQNKAVGRIPVSDADGWLTLTDPSTSGGVAGHWAGDIKMSMRADPGADHGKWLLCDGRAISRTTYATLFGVIGTKFGAGDGSTTFNLPNGANRMIRGAPSPYSNPGVLSGADVFTLDQTHLPVDTLIAAGTSRAVTTTSGTTTFIQRKSTAAASYAFVPSHITVNFFIYAG